MIAERALNAWKSSFDAGIKRPVTEADYEELLEFTNELTDNYNIDLQPWSDLFGLIGGYMHEWELENEPELKNPQAEPYQMLAHFMEQQDVTQYQLDKEGVVDQGNLSAILKGKRGISLELAKRLAERFGVSVELFI